MGKEDDNKEIITSTYEKTYLNWLEKDDEVLVNIDDCFSDTYMFQDKLRVKEIAEMERALNHKE